jgi:hypothetical protein
MRFLIVALILLAPLPIFAVEHDGSVRAADQFIPGATVTARQGGAKLVTYTDENGRYSLDLTPGVWEIEIGMFGFKTLTAPITIRDSVTNNDWTLEMPRPGEVVTPPKPAAAAETKKPDAAPAVAASTPAPAALKPAATPGAGRRGAGGQQGRGGRGGPGAQQQAGQPAFQNADVTATDAGAQALAMAGTDMGGDLGADSADAYMVVGTTSGGLGAAADEQAARMAMMGGRGGRGGPGGMGGPGGDMGLMSLGASLGGNGGDPLGMGGFGAAGADAGFGADAGAGGFGLGGPGGGAGGGGGRGGAGGGGGGGRGGGGGGRGGGGGGGGGRGAAGGRGGRGPFNGQFASIGNRRGRGRQSPYSGSIAVTATNSALNAAPYSLNGQSQTKPSSARESITGNFGGPLRIPKIYNVANPKWQFYLNFTVNQGRTGSSQVSEVPTLAERMGDFSQAVVKQSVGGVAAYVPVTIYDPLNGAPFPTITLPDGTTRKNVVPASRIRPTAQSLMQYIPLPQFSNLVQNYDVSPSNPSHTRSFAVRLNGRVNSKNTLTVNQQFSFNGSNSLQTGIVDNNNNVIDTTNGYGMSSSVIWTHIFKPRFNNSASLTFSRNLSKTDPYFADRTDVATNLGIVGPDHSPQAWGPPNLSFNNFGSVKDGDYGSTRSQTTAFTDTVTYIYKRNHNLSFGLGYRRMQQNSLSFSNSGGAMSFNGLLTAGTNPDGTAIANTGFDFADFLLGYPDSSSLRVNDSNLYYRGWAANAFAQDDWRVKPGLTLNLGLRWEFFSPYTELHGQMATLDLNSSLTLACPVGAAAVATNVSTANGCPANAILNGPFTGRFPDALVNDDPREFSPRLGFAWRPSQKHSRVIRGGYSVFYSGAAYSAMARNLAGQPQFSTTANLVNSATFVKAGNGLTINCAFIVSAAQGCPALGPAPAAGVVTNTYAINKNYLPAYAQDWMLAMSQTLPHNLVVDLEYIGIKGTRLDVVENPNQLPPNSVAGTPVRVTNASGFIYETDTGNSIYNAAQVRFTRRMTRGVSAVALYTFSKAIDDASGFTGGGSGSVVQDFTKLYLERGLSSTDQRHRLSIQSVLSSPVGIHGMFRNGGWKTKVLTGWTLNPTLNIASGLPQTAMLGGSTGASKTSGVRASYRAEATGASIFGGSGPYFNEAAFTTPPAGQYGDAGVDTIPGLYSFMLSAALNRAWRFGETRKNLQVRLSTNNALNHVQITKFGTTVGSSTFGLPTGASGTRTVSLMMRFSF